MNEIKSSEAKIKKKPESNEIARSVGSFSGWGGKSREFRLETLKHWDPPEGCVGWRQPTQRDGEEMFPSPSQL